MVESIHRLQALLGDCLHTRMMPFMSKTRRAAGIPMPAGNPIRMPGTSVRSLTAMGVASVL
jgi:hypothetical protein